MTRIAIELPEDIPGRLAVGDQDLSRLTLESLAAQGYRNGQLSHAEVQRILSLTSRWETDAFLKEARAYIDYTEADLERDLDVSRQS